MAAFTSHCCAKTFFLGEYGAVATQRALLWLTEPRFSATFGDPGQKPSPLSLPCQRLLAAEAPELQDIGYQFIDPYHGKGGMGASSAEFLLWMRAISFYRAQSDRWHHPAQWPALLEAYTRHSWSGRGVPPSGVDVVAQNYSGLLYVDVPQGIYQSITWPFTEVGVVLAHTNQKLATHAHLETQPDASLWTSLSDWVDSAVNALGMADIQRFVGSMQGAYQQQLSLGLVATHTQHIVTQLAASSAFLVAKGCGAMGSDVILGLYPLSRQEEALERLSEQGCEVLTTLSV